MLTHTAAAWIRDHAWTTTVHAQARGPRARLVTGPCPCLVSWTSAPCTIPCSASPDPGDEEHCDGGTTVSVETALLADRQCVQRCHCPCHHTVAAWQFGLFEVAA